MRGGSGAGGEEEVEGCLTARRLHTFCLEQTVSRGAERRAMTGGHAALGTVLVRRKANNRPKGALLSVLGAIQTLRPVLISLVSILHRSLLSKTGNCVCARPAKRYAWWSGSPGMLTCWSPEARASPCKCPRYACLSPLTVLTPSSALETIQKSLRHLRHRAVRENGQ